jgi:hypothetical protein
LAFSKGAPLTAEEAAEILSCEAGWPEELARQRKVPYTEL